MSEIRARHLIGTPLPAQTVLQALDASSAPESSAIIRARGGGIAGHPDGIGSGRRAAWQAARSGIPHHRRPREA